METVIRVAVVYLLIMLGLRILGKREFSQLSALELVALLLIPELVSQSLTGDDYSVTNGVVAVATLFTLVFLTSMAMHLSQTAEKVVSGQPQVLVQHGQIVEDAMNKERVTPDEVFSSMHLHGLDRLQQVKWAILESDGKIAIVPEEWAQGEFRRDSQELNV